MALVAAAENSHSFLDAALDELSRGVVAGEVAGLRFRPGDKLFDGPEERERDAEEGQKNGQPDLPIPMRLNPGRGGHGVPMIVPDLF